MADIRVTSEIDNFSRADENPLSAGGNYAQVRTSGDFSQQLQNKSNDAWPQTGAAHFSASYWTPESFTGDMEMWGEVTGFTDNQNAWYLCFIKDVGTANIDGYICGWIDAVGDRIQIRRFDNGSATLIKDVALSNLPNGGDLLLLRTVGNDLQAWQSVDAGANWSMDTSVTDSTYRTGLSLTLALFSSASNGPKWAGWGGGQAVDFIPQIYRRPFG